MYAQSFSAGKGIRRFGERLAIAKHAYKVVELAVPTLQQA